jgi:hypothetical protein
LKKAIVLTDLRILPLLTACYLSKKIKNSGIVFSEFSLACFDFGFTFPKWYNKFKIFIISLFFNIKILKISKQINEPDESELICILSSMVSMTNDSLADKVKYPKLYLKLLLSYNASISIKKYLMDVDTLEEIYLFNGRTASSEPILRFFFNSSVRILFYEYPLIFSASYTLYDFPIHDNYKYGCSLYQFYKLGLKPNFVTNTNEYIANKLNNKFTQFYKSSESLKFDIVIFLGSDHELIFLNKEINNNIVFTNLELIQHTVKKFGNNFSYAVRSHPNQRNDPSFLKLVPLIEEYCQLNNVAFFRPDSDVSSYELINNCNLVVVGYSSIAEDAIYLGKKVEFMGNSDISAIIDQLPSRVINNTTILKDLLGDILKLRSVFLHNNFSFFYKIVFHLTFRIDILIIKFYKHEIKKYF